MNSTESALAFVLLSISLASPCVAKAEDRSNPDGLVGYKCVGQLHQDLARLRQGLPKLALQVTLDGIRGNGHGLRHGAHPFVRVHRRQLSENIDLRQLSAYFGCPMANRIG